MNRNDTTTTYVVKAYNPGDLSQQDLLSCVDLVNRGCAVALEEEEFGRVQRVAVGRQGDKVIAVGAIKRVRTYYTSQVAKRSGFCFPCETSELGYVAVAPEHRGNKLSRSLVAVLLVNWRGSLFATTGNRHMKKTLLAAGFQQKGHEWQGQRGTLSLWIRDKGHLGFTRTASRGQ